MVSDKFWKYFAYTFCGCASLTIVVMLDILIFEKPVITLIFIVICLLIFIRFKLRRRQVPGF